MTTPIASPEDAARTVEQASLAFLHATTAEDRSAAERWLLEIRRWPNPLACCRQLLLHSTVGYAKMQALVMMRECLGAQWLALSPADRTELQQLLLRLLADGSAEPYVRAVAAQNLAVHAKHDLLHAPAPAGGGPAPVASLDALLQAATQMLDEPSGTHAPAALEILHSLLCEFGAPSSGALGGALAWSMHARARAAFQAHHLLRVVHIGLQQLQRLHAAAPPLPPHQTRALTLCSSLLTSALSWDFDGVGEAAAVGDARPGLNASVVKPPPSEAGWRELLGRTDLAAAVISMHSAHFAAASTSAGDAAEALVHSLRQLVVMLASVSRRVFADDAAHAAYAQTLLHCLAELLAVAPDARAGGAEKPVRGELAFRDGCVALQRLVVCSGPEALLALPSAAFDGTLRMLHAATMHTVTAAMRPPSDDDDDDGAAALVESHDVLLEAWVSILYGTGSLRRRPPAVEEAASLVYDACVRAKLHASAQAAAQCAEEEVDELPTRAPHELPCSP